MGLFELERLILDLVSEFEGFFMEGVFVEFVFLMEPQVFICKIFD